MGCADAGPAEAAGVPVRFNHLSFGFPSSVILLDSKAQQTELEWISYPPNGVSEVSRDSAFHLHDADVHICEGSQ